MDLATRDSAGDRLGLLFERHRSELYALARRMSGDPEEARDLVQETFLRAARRIDSLPESSSRARAWLYRILVNLCRDRWRRAAVRRHARAHIAAGRANARDARPGGSPAEAAAVARSTVQRALSWLSPRRRAVVVLHEIEGLDSREVARRLGIGPVTVRWHLSAARRELRRRLSDGDS